MRTVKHYGEAEWLKWRRGGISASDAAIIAGEVKKPSRVDLWIEKLGKGTPTEATEAMRFGKAMESAIAAMYTQRTHKRVMDIQICGECSDSPYPMRATIDAMDENGDILEFKAVSVGGARFWPEDGDADNLPARVIYQVQHQMRVADANRVLVVAAIPLELRIYEVRRREEIIGPLMALEESFWGYVASEEYPDRHAIDDADAEVFIKAFGVKENRIGLSMEIQEVVDDYEMLGTAIRNSEAEKKRLKDRILSAMCNNRYAELPDGRILDCKLIEIAERTQVVKAHTQLRLTVKRPSEGR